MHWIFWVIIASLVFLVTYNPRSGTLGKFFGPELSVEGKHASRTTQSDSDTRESSE